MEVIITSIYIDLTRKTDFFEEGSWSKLNNLRLVLGMALKIYSSVEKWLKLKFSMEVIITSIYMDLTRKTDIFEEWSLSKLNNLGLVLVMALKIYSSIEKGLKLKVRKFRGLILLFGD